MEFLSPHPSTPSKLMKRSVSKHISTGLTLSFNERLNSIEKSDEFSEKGIINETNQSLTKRRNNSTNKNDSKPCESPGDRYIANRANQDYEFCNYFLNSPDYRENNAVDGVREKSKSNSARILAELHTPINKRVMNCFQNSSNKTPSEATSSPIHSINREQCTSSSIKRPLRFLPNKSFRTLDAPDLMDDYYLNLLHWGNNNKLAVALRNTVYIWNPVDSQIESIPALTEEDAFVGSVKWSTIQDNILAIGTSHNSVQIWDATKLVLLREMEGHSARVGSLSWNNHIISSGSRDSTILNHDIRQSRSITSRYNAHQQEVCGLAWSPGGSVLVSFSLHC